MRGRLAAVKNLIWALGIVVCLLAVFVGLLFSAFTRSSEEQFRGGVPLGTTRVKSETGQTASRPLQVADGTLKVLGETRDAGQDYLDSLTFLVDSTMIGLRDYGILSGGTETTQVWATPSGILAVTDMAESRIVFPNDGSIVSAANAAMILRPEILVISLGNDGTAGYSRFEFIEEYEKLILSIRETSPATSIVCLPLTSVTASYPSTDGSTPELSNMTVEWIQTICADTGAWYADAVSGLLDSSGALMAEYASANGKTLNSTGLNVILQYLRNHEVP